MQGSNGGQRSQKLVYLSIAASACAVAGTFLLAYDQIITNNKGEFLGIASEWVLAVSVTLLFLGATGRVLLQYLTSDTSTGEPVPSAGRHDFAELLKQIPSKTELEELRAQLEAVARNVNNDQLSLTTEERQRIVESIQRRVKADLSIEFLKQVDTLYSERAINTKIGEVINARYGETRDRLLKELENLALRANLNLTIGILTTIVAILLLGYVVYEATKDGGTISTSTNWEQLLPSLAIRLSLAIFIEVFAFFFLQLYRAGLSEIKYFQNELTNVEARQIALLGAFAHPDSTTAKSVIEQLAATDRNYILKTGESTPDIERLKSENEGVRDLMANIAQIIKPK